MISWINYRNLGWSHWIELNSMQKMPFPPSLGACVNSRQNSRSTEGRVRHCGRLSRICSDTYDIEVHIIKVLGEGGFSFVYLAQDEVSGVRSRSSTYCLDV